jgi:hypothetical protein
MSEQDPDEPAEFVDQFQERFHRHRSEHGGEMDRLDPDQLDRLTEEERVAAGVDAYDPDEVPSATDTPPLTDESGRPRCTRKNAPRSAARKTRARCTRSTRSTRSRPPATTTRREKAEAGQRLGKASTRPEPQRSGRVAFRGQVP